MKDPRSIEAMEEALKLCQENSLEYHIYSSFTRPYEIEISRPSDGRLFGIFDLRDCVKWKKHEEEEK